MSLNVPNEWYGLADLDIGKQLDHEYSDGGITFSVGIGGDIMVYSHFRSPQFLSRS
jgi:hypothetical protein